MRKRRAQLCRLKVKTKPNSPNYNLVVIIKTGKLAIDVCWHQKWFNFCVLCLFSSTSSEKILVNKSEFGSNFFENLENFPQG